MAYAGKKLMIKQLIFLLLISLSGCAQQLYNAQIEMHNSCPTSVSVLVEGFTNSGRSATPLSIDLQSNQIGRVASRIGFGCCELGKFLPENYQITLYISDKTKILNREMVIMKSVKNDQKSTRDTHFLGARNK